MTEMKIKVDTKLRKMYIMTSVRNDMGTKCLDTELYVSCLKMLVVG